MWLHLWALTSSTRRQSTYLMPPRGETRPTDTSWVVSLIFLISSTGQMPGLEKLRLAARGVEPRRHLDARPDLAYGRLPAAAGEQRSQDTPRRPEARSHSDLDAAAT